MTDEDTPIEAGLGFAVRFDKGAFLGSEVLLAQKQHGVKKRLVQFALEDGAPALPAVIAAAGEPASMRFIEFFTANIRNPNTRAAYARVGPAANRPMPKLPRWRNYRLPWSR